MAGIPGAGPDLNQELGVSSGFYRWMTRAQEIEPSSTAFPLPVVETWIRTGAAILEPMPV